MLSRFIIIFFLASCASGFIVKIDSDDAFNATKYKTFKVFKPDPFNVESDEEENPIRINRIAKALVVQLTERGLAENDGSPLKISFAVKEKDRQRDGFSSRFSYGYRNDPFSYRFYSHEQPPLNYLSVRFFDEDLDKVVWYANLRINPSALDNQELVNEIILKVLSKYPNSS